jgi:hypothetical protein
MADDSTQAEEQAGDRFSVRVVVNREQSRGLIARVDLDFGDRPTIRPQSEDRAIVAVFATREQIAGLEADGLEVKVVHNESARGRASTADIGQGDRFEGGRVPPRGLGQKVGRRTPSGGGTPTGS